MHSHISCGNSRYTKCDHNGKNEKMTLFPQLLLVATSLNINLFFLLLVREQLIVLPSGSTDENLETLTYLLQLGRVGSETMHTFEKEESFRSRSILYSSKPRSPSFSHRTEQLQVSHDLRDFDQERSRFSLPVKRFVTKSKKSNNKSFQTEHHQQLGKHLDRDLDHRPLPGSLPNHSEGSPHPQAIIITAEIHESPSSTLLTSAVDDSDIDDIEKDEPTYVHEKNVLSPAVESPDVSIPDYFSPDYMKTLEQNFVHNHLNGVTSGDLHKCLKDIVQQCQVIETENIHSYQLYVVVAG